MHVHSPSTPIHSLSEFLTHMAAITLGLLLALGIEQTAKYVHDQGKIAEARKALEEERQGNILTIGVATTNFRDAVAKTQRNLAIFLCIQSNKSRDCDKARDKINWYTASFTLDDVAWQTAQQSSVTSLMPQDEVRIHARRYKWLERVSTDAADWWRARRDSRSYGVLDSDPTHFTPTQLEQQIELTKKDLVHMYRYGLSLVNLAKNFPEFQGPTRQEVLRIVHEGESTTKQ